MSKRWIAAAAAAVLLIAAVGGGVYYLLSRRPDPGDALPAGDGLKDSAETAERDTEEEIDPDPQEKNYLDKDNGLVKIEMEDLTPIDDSIYDSDPDFASEPESEPGSPPADITEDANIDWDGWQT